MQIKGQEDSCTLRPIIIVATKLMHVTLKKASPNVDYRQPARNRLVRNVKGHFVAKEYFSRARRYESVCVPAMDCAIVLVVKQVDLRGPRDVSEIHIIEDDNIVRGIGTRALIRKLLQLVSLCYEQRSQSFLAAPGKDKRRFPIATRTV